MIADRELTLEDIVRYNMHRPFEERRALLYGEGPTFQVRTLANELPSFLVGGLPGFGKTSAVSFLCCQMVMCQARLVIIDPHMFAPRDSLAKIVAPLSNWFALPMIDFEDTGQVVNAFQYVLDEYERRNRKHAHIGDPLFLVCDEWNLLLDLLDDDELEVVIQTVRTVARSARKFGIWLCLIAQNWNLDSSGGPDVRKAITGRLAFSAEMSDMRMVLNTRDNHSLAELCATPMQKGQCIFKHPSYGMKRVWYPKMDVHECEAVATVMRHGQSEFSGFSGYSTSESTRFFPKIQYPEFSAPSPLAIVPYDRTKPFSSPPPNTLPPNLNTDLNIQHFTLNNLPIQHKKGVKISKEDIQVIVDEGNRQIRETGRVNRTLIRDDLGWNSHGYLKIQAVCDALGWGLSMGKDEIDPGVWAAIKKHYNSTCQKCHRKEPDVRLEPDRIVPGVKGGSYSDTNNIQPLCHSCNSSKREKIIDYRPDREPNHV